MRYAVFRTNMRSFTSSFLFHFILELLSILMVMVNIRKAELINANENCLLNISSVGSSILPTELILIHHILIWSRSRGIDKIWTNKLYDILSNE